MIDAVSSKLLLRGKRPIFTGAQMRDARQEILCDRARPIGGRERMRACDGQDPGRPGDHPR